MIKKDSIFTSLRVDIYIISAFVMYLASSTIKDYSVSLLVLSIAGVVDNVQSLVDILHKKKVRVEFWTYTLSIISFSVLILLSIAGIYGSIDWVHFNKIAFIAPVLYSALIIKIFRGISKSE